MTFRVGQKVVCVDAEYVDGISEGEVYDVLWIGPLDTEGYYKGQLMPPGSIVIEIAIYDTMTWRYAAHRFRPIIERKTDITIFREIDRKVFDGVDA